MAHTPSWLRAAHRAHAALTIVVLVVLLVLNLTGVVSTELAVILFLAVELPLAVVFVVLTVLRFRRREPAQDAPRLGLLDRLETEEPLLRPAVFELRAFGSIALAATGRRRIPPGAIPFGYTKGTMTLPVALVIVSIIELVVVHLIVPWLWLQIVLLVLTVWGMLFITGLFTRRIVNPHFVTTDALHLRWGHRTVLVTPLSNIASASLEANHAHTYPVVENDTIVLTQFQSTNVRLRLTAATAASPPVSKKQVPPGFRAVQVQLYVDDPRGLVDALTRRAGNAVDGG